MGGESKVAVGYMPQLDGLRALAVISVAVFHWHHPEIFGVGLDLGTAGVNLFFVLSGFLITGILIDVRNRIGDDKAARIVALKAFWVRRVLRLVPALLLYLAVTYSVGYTGDREGFWWYLTYLGNFRIAQIDRWPVGGSHLWSLAVEEQFYLFIPLIALWVGRRRLGQAFVAGTGISLVAYAMSGAAGRLLPPAAFVGLFIGCACAVAFQHPGARRVGDALSGVWFLVLIPVMLLRTIPGLSEGLVGMTLWLLYNLGAAGFVWRAAIGRSGTVFEWGPMVWIGRISYGLYLWHFFGDWVFGLVVPDAPTLVRFLGASFVTVAIAHFSFVVFENRFIVKKSNFPYVKPAAATVEATSGGTV